MKQNLFNAVFENVYIISIINHYLYLMETNETITITSIKEFLKNPHRIYCLKLNILCNEPLEPKGILFEGIKELNFGKEFKQLLTSGDIPMGVEKLKIESSKCLRFPMNQLKDNYQGLLPSSVKELTMTKFNVPLDDIVNFIPPNLEILIIPRQTYYLHPNQLPSKIKELNLASYNHPLLPKVIPSSVTQLTLTKFNSPLEPNHLPNIQTLELIYFNQPLGKNHLPPSLKHLKFRIFNQDFDIGTFPSTLETLNLGNCFNSFIKPFSIPSRVTALNLGHSFNYPLLPNSIPPNCEYLLMGDCFKQPIYPNILPRGLKVLTLASKFNYISTLSLRGIKQNNFYNHPINQENMPSSLEVLGIHKRCRNTSFIDLPDHVEIKRTNNLSLTNKYLY